MAKRLNRSFKKLLKELHELENERHTLNRKIRKIRISWGWVMHNEKGIEIDNLYLKHAGVTRRIRKIRSLFMRSR